MMKNKRPIPFLNKIKLEIIKLDEEKQTKKVKERKEKLFILLDLCEQYYKKKGLL